VNFPVGSLDRKKSVSRMSEAAKERTERTT